MYIDPHYPTSAWDGTEGNYTAEVEQTPDTALTRRLVTEVVAMQNDLINSTGLMTFYESLVVGDADKIVSVNAEGTDYEYRTVSGGDGITVAASEGSLAISVTAGSSNAVLGMNVAGDATEFKVLSSGNGITVTHTTGNVAFVADSYAVFNRAYTEKTAEAVVVGMAVDIDSNGEGIKADKDASTSIQGLCAATADGTLTVKTFGPLTLTTGEWDAVTGGSGGLTPGEDYYVTDGGALSTTIPSTTGEAMILAGKAESATVMFVKPCFIGVVPA